METERNILIYLRAPLGEIIMIGLIQSKVKKKVQNLGIGSPLLVSISEVLTLSNQNY